MNNPITHPLETDVCISVNPGKVFRLLSICACCLVLLDGAGYYFKLNLTKFIQLSNIYFRLFNLNTEGNIPTYFSAGLLLVAACLLLIITMNQYNQKKIEAKYWAFLSVIFLFLSVDEIAQVHESVTELINIMATKPSFNFIGSRPGFLRYVWVVPYLIAVIAIGIYLLRFVLSLPKSTMIQFVLSGIIFISGAVGLELLEGHYDSMYDYFNRYSSVLYSLEEACEMFGVIIFIHALLRFMVGENNCLVIWISRTNTAV